MFRKVYSIKINVIANFAGSIWTGFLSIAFVPLYLHYINIESYGLIGIFTSIQAFISLLDFGLSPTFNREISRLSALENQAQEMHDVKRTLEIPNWITALLIALILSAFAPLIARFWVQPKDLSVETVTQAFLIMSINVALQFSISFYTGGLMGLQKQLLLNLINIICGTLRSVGAFLVLAFLSPTIQFFLLWQGVIAILQVFLVAFTLKYSLPQASRNGRFQMDSFSRMWRFAAGMTGIGILSLILTQTDKVILSRMLTLEMFGYYTLAVTISTLAIGTLVSSITHAVYPQLSRLVSVNDEAGLRDFYHRSCQFLSAFLLPLVIVLALYSYDILLVWTRKEELAANTYLLLSLVSIGTGLNGLLWLPYMLQLSYGWTKLAFYMNIGAIIIIIPLMIFGVYHYGAIGGAVGWVVINGSYIFVSIPIMHRRLLKGEQQRWYLESLVYPLITALTVVAIGKLLLKNTGSNIETLLKILIISATAFFATALSISTVRRRLMKLPKELTAIYTQ